MVMEWMTASAGLAGQEGGGREFKLSLVQTPCPSLVRGREPTPCLGAGPGFTPQYLTVQEGVAEDLGTGPGQG